MTLVGRDAPSATAASAASVAGATRRLCLHVAGLALVLAALLPVMTPLGAFTSDEGAYALQAQSLRNGSWAYDYRAAPLDPTRASFPITLSQNHGTTYFTYIQHPAYPLLIAGAEAVAGRALGLHLWPLAGVLGTAIAAWLLVGEIEPRLRAPAFWVAATGPVVVNGYLAWAHSLSAAVAGFTLLAAVRIFKRGPTFVRVCGLAAGSAAGVLLRSEGLLFAGAVGLVLAVATWWVPVEDRRKLRHLARTAFLFAASAGTALFAALGERVWVHAIAGGAYNGLQSRSGSSGYLAGRLNGAWRDLFGAPALAVLAMAVVVWFGTVSLRRWRSGSLAAIAVGTVGGVALLAYQVIRHPSDPILGLFAAWPLVLLGLVVAPWRSVDVQTRFVAAVTVVFCLAVVATEYPDGGGLEWGGRFFAALLAPLAVLAVVGLDRRLAPAGGKRRLVAGLLGVVTLATAASALYAVGRSRADNQGVVDAVARHPAPLTVTTVIALPRIGWSIDDRVTWMLTQDSSLPTLLASLHGKGVQSLDLVVQGRIPASVGPYHVVLDAREPALAKHGMALLQLQG